MKPAYGGVLTISRSGAPGWTGRWRPIDSPRCARRWGICQSRNQLQPRSRGCRPGSPRYRGDLDAERKALERLVAVDPTDFAALDRLMAIAEKEGKADRAGALRLKKSELYRILARYEKLDKRNQTIRNALEMASLAERLGHRFEARVFRTIAIATDPEHRQPGDQLLRSSQDVSTTNSPAGTLAELLAEELDAADRATAR